MDNDKTLARIYEHLDDDDVEKAVIACLRLARGTKVSMSFIRKIRNLGVCSMRRYLSSKRTAGFFSTRLR
jgi:hypothetical protein